MPPGKPTKYNPPPNWPAPPAGWTPPPGWQPDPDWGPAPEGWQVWLSESPEPPRPEGPQKRAPKWLWLGLSAAVVLWALADLIGLF